MSRSNSKKLKLSQNIVAKSNSFSMAKLSQGLTLCQTQLLMYAIFATQKQKDNIECEFKKSDFEKQFNISQLRTNVADKDAKRLASLLFSTQDLENEKFAYYTVFQYIKYDKGTFNFKWSDFMIPHILDLKERYVITDFEVTSKFVSAFSWSLYDFIKANYGKWFSTLSKEAVLRLFSVESKKSYSNTGALKKNVLDVAIAELNAKTELNINYEEKRKGRSIIGFTLKWSVGTVEMSATAEQMEQIKMYIDTIEDDAAKYMRLKNVDRFNRARELMITVADYSATLDDIDLTAEKANSLILKLKAIFKELERIVKDDNENRYVPYNWLEED